MAFPAAGITQLKLRDFRSYTFLDLALDTRPVVLWGLNGAGKTNILEAISLLSPGRGLRRARLSEMHLNQAQSKGWSIECTLSSPQQVASVALYADLTEGRERRFNTVYGRTVKSLAAFSEYASVIWLTPAMDRLFTESPAGRRRFLDRLVFALYPSYVTHAANYEKALKERNKALLYPSRDTVWLKAIEHSLATEGAALSLARLQVVDLLNHKILSRSTNFPKPTLRLEGKVEEWLQQHSTEETVDLLKTHLTTEREYDSASGSTRIGPHKSDLLTYHQTKNIDAALCSTGEQKALLLSIILAFSELMKEYSKGTPILLLDEAVAHLDSCRRQDLFEEIFELSLQVWMTGTDSTLFSGLEERAQFFQVIQAEIFAQSFNQQGTLI